MKSHFNSVRLQTWEGTELIALFIQLITSNEATIIYHFTFVSMAQSYFFEIATKGTCLFCLSPNCAPLDKNKMDLTTSTALKMLFRYLQIDIRKLVNVSSCGSVSLDSLTNLAASLCDACFFLIDEFLELFQDFERIRLKLEGCTWKLHEFIKSGNKNEGRVREYRNRVATSRRDELHASFVEKLRLETSDKCSRKRGPSIPNISLRRDVLDIFENSSDLRTNRMVIASNSKLGEIIKTQSLPATIEEEDGNFTEATYDKRFIKNPTLFKFHRYNHVGNKFHSQAKGRTRKCVYCSRYFPYYSDLNAHQFLVHPVQMLSKFLPLGVSELDVKGAVDRILGSVKVVTNKKGAKLTCPVCRELFAGDVKLRLHILRIHKDHVSQSIHQGQTPAMTPPRCSAGESVQEKVYQQIKSSPPAISPLEEYNIPCDICGKRFTSLVYMTRHKTRFHREWSFKCDLCPRLFLYHKTLERHLQEFHSKKPVHQQSNSTSWSCDYCDKVYPFRNGLQHHLDVKHAMQLYASQIPSHISEHVFESTVAAIVEKILLPVEAGNRVYQKSPCVFCGKALPCASNPYLRVHILRHHMEKVIENAEKAIMIEKGPTGNDTTTSSMIPCKIEYSPVIPNQFEDESGFELEGEEHSLAEEDPLGI